MKLPITGLYAIIDSTYLKPEEMAGAAVAAIEGGASVLQLRAKGLGGGELLEVARALKKVAANKGVPFIVNDRADIALLSGADGVHIGQDDIPLKEARKLLGGDMIIGVSTHNLKEALEAEAVGADYISFGPIFPTSTKKDADVPKGAEHLKELKNKTKLPVVAIGGITGENLAKIVCSGADAAAVISCLLTAPDIGTKAMILAGFFKK